MSRVEDYGAFVTINYNGKEVKGFLERDEAKVRSAYTFLEYRTTLARLSYGMDGNVISFS